MILWDSRSVKILKSWRDVFSVSVAVEDLSNKSKWLITSVYDPNDSQRRKEMWNESEEIRGRWDGAWCIGGDWNIVRFPSEKSRAGSTTEDMKSVSDWINSQALVDLPLKGASFTWSNHQSSPTLSRLDRFLVSNEWLDLYPEVCQLALPKVASDYCPIMLDSNLDRWGPTPFRFELMWLEEKNFTEKIRGWWREMKIEGWAGYRLITKLKLLKLKIKEWATPNFVEGVQKAYLLEEVQKWIGRRKLDNFGGRSNKNKS